MRDAPIQSTPPTLPIDEPTLRRAAESGNIPTLIAVLYQLTGDCSWLTDRYRPTRSRGMDDNATGGLSADIQAEIRAAFVSAMLAWTQGCPLAVSTMSDAELMLVVDFIMGETVPHEFGPMLREMIGFDAASSPMPTRSATGHSVIVIGAGVGGLLASMRLTEAGIEHVVLEKNMEVGGSWWENSYPGAGVDTPSYLYSFSFFQHSWSTHFGKRDEVEAYLQKFAHHYGLRDRIQFGTEVTAARYDDDAQTWTVNAVDSAGEMHVLTADLVISAVGLLNRPKLPHLPGIDSFRGELFHSARWPDDIDLTGKRVALVGAGASAMQIGPAIAAKVQSLSVFQRSPQWIAPNDAYFTEVGDDVTWLMENVPFYLPWYRARLAWTFNDKVHPSLKVDPAWTSPQTSINATNDGHRAFYTRYIADQLGDRHDLIEKCVPDYPPFGKRMLLDNGWYKMLTKSNVALVTSGVSDITATGLVDADGIEHEFDVIILATGFHADQLLHPMDIVGRSGSTTRETWGEHDARAYLGITVPDFPNFFIMTGPNTGLGHGGSFITILECQIRYIMDAISKIVDDDLGSIECRQDVCDDYNKAVDDAHAQMVWTHPGMENWYRNADGRVVAVLPWRIIDYWNLTRNVNLDDFRTTPAARPTPSDRAETEMAHSCARVLP